MKRPERSPIGRGEAMQGRGPWGRDLMFRARSDSADYQSMRAASGQNCSG
jgi:hypothetical protein